MTDTDKTVEKNLKVIIPVIRFVGLMIFFFGMALIFDLGEVATNMDLVKEDLNKIIGMVLGIMGIIEVVLTPRILESVLGKNKK
jgi:hypothetical protein